MTAETSELHVLLVEDHGMLRRMLAKTLTEAGLRIAEASNGAEALALLQKGLRPRILFSDVRMPGPLNGLELARAARDILPTLPVLLQSGYTDLMVGDFRLLLKPYSPEELLACVAEMMAQGGT